MPKGFDMDGLKIYYDWARQLPSGAEKSEAALELCHMLMIALANHEYDYHKGCATHGETSPPPRGPAQT